MDIFSLSQYSIPKQRFYMHIWIYGYMDVYMGYMHHLTTSNHGTPVGTPGGPPRDPRGTPNHGTPVGTPEGPPRDPQGPPEHFRKFRNLVNFDDFWVTTQSALREFFTFFRLFGLILSFFVIFR